MLGDMNKKAKLIRLVKEKDTEGFIEEYEEIVANIRCYVEGRHGSEKWANLASFSEATDLFRFRKIPSVEVGTDMYVVFDNVRYDILSTENIKGKGMYIEVLARRNTPSDGKS